MFICYSRISASQWKAGGKTTSWLPFWSPSNQRRGPQAASHGKHCILREKGLRLPNSLKCIALFASCERLFILICFFATASLLLLGESLNFILSC